ncbi:hypothetical protein BD410DRAFT_846924 [Rickenella mellea]|nr:hypothetical protein BD410DRAFT_846924 [Rickenella mellea]
MASNEPDERVNYGIDRSIGRSSQISKTDRAIADPPIVQGTHSPEIISMTGASEHESNIVQGNSATRDEQEHDATRHGLSALRAFARADSSAEESEGWDEEYTRIDMDEWAARDKLLLADNTVSQAMITLKHAISVQREATHEFLTRVDKTKRTVDMRLSEAKF